MQPLQGFISFVYLVSKGRDETLPWLNETPWSFTGMPIISLFRWTESKTETKAGITVRWNVGAVTGGHTALRPPVTVVTTFSRELAIDRQYAMAAEEGIDLLLYGFRSHKRNHECFDLHFSFYLRFLCRSPFDDSVAFWRPPGRPFATLSSNRLYFFLPFYFEGLRARRKPRRLQVSADVELSRLTVRSELLL